jgi:hypothetical protein
MASRKVAESDLTESGVKKRYAYLTIYKSESSQVVVNLLQRIWIVTKPFAIQPTSTACNLRLTDEYTS